ncbi:MAG: hypothetical protein PHH00_01210 [Candidatus Nanoarchaeia archaeon]|nr:hypothetical protein [Candidatus Nanoarchaeia archaeon]
MSEYYKEMIKGLVEMDIHEVAIYAENKQEVGEITEASLGFYDVKRMSPNEAPQVLRQRVGLRLTRLEASGAW